eukprot:scaffold2580_cov388-Prasinococcus_capsulatus_cf.AAC.23
MRSDWRPRSCSHAGRKHSRSEGLSPGEQLAQCHKALLARPDQVGAHTCPRWVAMVGAAAVRSCTRSPMRPRYYRSLGQPSGLPIPSIYLALGLSSASAPYHPLHCRTGC